MALVACKTCGKELGKGVKKCIHCGADQRNFFAKHKILTGVLVLVVLGVFGAAFGGGGESNSTQTASSPPAQPTEVNKQVGTPFSTDKFEITVVSAEVRNQVGVEFLEANPAEGGEYIAVVWKYKNITKEPIGTFSQPSLILVDPTGIEYESDINASASYATEKKLTEKFLSDLNPGITVTGAEVFEVAKGQYDPATWTVLVRADQDVTVGLK